MLIFYICLAVLGAIFAAAFISAIVGYINSISALNNSKAALYISIGKFIGTVNISWDGKEVSNGFAGSNRGNQ